MATAILFSANSGVAGDLNGVPATVVESAIFDPTLVPDAFGLPVKMLAGKIAKIESGDVAADFYGILSRSAPTVAGGTTITNSGQPNADTVSGVVVGGPGYVLVKCTIGTPVRGGDVFMRVVDAGPNLIGDLEANADGVNNVLLSPAVVWAVDGLDSNNVTGVRVK